VLTPDPTPNEQLSEFLSRFDPSIAVLAKKCLSKLRRTFPGSNEIVYDYSKSVVVTFSASERGYEGVVSIAFFADRVQLYFDKSIPDPKRLLTGSGTKVRFVTLETLSDFDREDIQALIKAAKKRSGATFPRTGSTKMIIKSDSKKKKPAK
jgi:hypothetical protein